MKITEEKMTAEEFALAKKALEKANVPGPHVVRYTDGKVVPLEQEFK